MNRFRSNLDWLLTKLRGGRWWCALLSLSLALSLAALVVDLRPREGPGRYRLEDRTVETALASGFEVPVSEGHFGLFAVTLTAGFVTLLVASAWLNGWLERRLGSEALAAHRSGLLLLGQLALAVYILKLIVGEAATASMRVGLHLLAGLLILSMLALAFVTARLKRDRERWSPVWGLLGDDKLLLAALFWPVGIIAAFDSWWGSSLAPLRFLSGIRGFLDYSVVLWLLFGICVLLARGWDRQKGSRPGPSLYENNTGLIAGGSALILIPLALQLANELQYTFAGRDLAWLPAVTAVVLLATSAVIYVQHRRGRLRWSGAAVLTRVYYPLTVATLASFRTHRQVIDLGSLDYFAAGVRLLPTQQWLDFGRLPLLELVPVNGLSDVGFPALFAWLNGMRDLDMLVWQPWLPTVAGFLSIYVFLAVVTTPLLALLVTVFLPIHAVVVGPYAVALLPATALVLALRKPTFGRFIWLWVLSALLTLWRPGLGWTTWLALLLVVPLAALAMDRKILAPAAAALAAVAALLPLSLLLSELVAGGDSWQSLKAFVAGIPMAADRALYGLVLIPSTAGLAAFVSQLLPVVALITLLVLGVRRLVMGRQAGPTDFGLLSLVIFSLMAPPRIDPPPGGVFDPSLVLLLLALLPFLLVGRVFRPQLVGRSSWLMLTVVLCALLGRIDLYHLTGDETVHRPRSWTPEARRVLYDDGPHRQLVDYLRGELDDAQTFLDFTNSPALYGLVGRRLPFLEVPDFRVTSESRQRLQLEQIEQARQTTGIPLLVFRGPPALEAGTPELPVPATSFRLSEYLYDRYVPFVSVAGWEIWRQKGELRGRPTPPARALSATSLRQEFELGSLPFRWTRGDPWQAARTTDIESSLLDQPTLVLPGMRLPLPLVDEYQAGKGYYLHLRARALPGLTVTGSARDRAILSIEYGDPHPSRIELAIAPWEYEESGTEEVLRLPLRDDPGTHNVEVAGRQGEGMHLRVVGGDPWIRSFVDPTSVRSVDAQEELWIRLFYRSSRAGTGQVFFTDRRRGFREHDSIRLRFAATEAAGESRQVVVPVVGVGEGGKLEDLRLDPPDGSDFEIVAVELVLRRREFDDYLVRISSQWRWFSGGVRRLRLTADAPVLVDSVVLRTGD